STGSVTGIAGPVDLDVFNGSSAELAAFAATGRAPTGERPRDTPLREGDAGPGVAEIQTRLKAKGFNPGPADGVFGPKTRAAVIAFQRAARLVVAGIVGPQTLAALRACPRPPPAKRRSSRHLESERSQSKVSGRERMSTESPLPSQSD